MLELMISLFIFMILTFNLKQMIKQKFYTPMQGRSVQKSVQTKNGITLIFEGNTVTVLVDPKHKIKTYFREGVEL